MMEVKINYTLRTITFSNIAKEDLTLKGFDEIINDLLKIDSFGGFQVIFEQHSGPISFISTEASSPFKPLNGRTTDNTGKKYP